MADKPLLNEDELARFLCDSVKRAKPQILCGKNKQDNWKWHCACESEARALARKMLACDLMYEALKTYLHDPDVHFEEVNRRMAAALQAAEEGR